ncbi:Sec translocon accessory complex subunit YajC [Buchnera aphidicola (Periphyllus testudinaceus)]|uniref:preprotein translocase subunit YajC n=1 Tax=Buchnera aphidicola TaxID=9 RepID=UPI003463EC0E
MNCLMNSVYLFSINSISKNMFSIVFFLLICLLFFYFFIFKPQKEKLNTQLKLINSIVVNDEVMTKSGFIGKVCKIYKNSYLKIELNKNIKVLIKRDFILAILPKGTLKLM